MATPHDRFPLARQQRRQRRVVGQGQCWEQTPTGGDMRLLDRRHFLGGALSLVLCEGAQCASPRTDWRVLFNGKDLSGWEFFQDGVDASDPNHVVAIDQGELRFLGPGFRGTSEVGFGHLVTTDTYSDYHLRLEYRWGRRRYAPRALAKRNSGLLYHIHGKPVTVFPDSVEFQIEETDVGDAILTNTEALEGPSLGGTPAWPDYPEFARREYSQPSVIGGVARQWFRRDGDFENRTDWNVLDLLAFKDRSAHLVNGRIVKTLFGMRRRDAAGASEWTSLAGGKIALEFEGAEIAFRHILVRPLSERDLTVL